MREREIPNACVFIPIHLWFVCSKHARTGIHVESKVIGANGTFWMSLAIADVVSIFGRHGKLQKDSGEWQKSTNAFFFQIIFEPN